MSYRSISRERFIKGAGVGAAALSTGIPAFIPRLGEAAETLKIGYVSGITGVYSAEAQSNMRGLELAVEAWNKRGGVMGRRVEVIKADDHSKPGTSVQKARQLVNEQSCVALCGTLSSAATLSDSAASATMGTLFVDMGGHADQISGAGCHWSAFQTCHTTWMLTHATGYSIAEKFGKKWFMLTPDYAFGHSLAAGYQDVLNKVGGQVVANELAPLGTTDFSSYLVKVDAAKPDCLIFLVAGQDFVNAIKQADTFGLLKKYPVAGPILEFESILELPKSARVGFWGVEWYYNSDLVFKKNNAVAADFVAEYRKRHKMPPTAQSCFGYVALDRICWAINETKSTDGVKLARALAGSPFKSVWNGDPFYRKVDHSLMWPVWFGQIRPDGTPADPYDLFNIVDRREPSQIAASEASQAKVCHLDWPS
ncbi:MAG: ABC transporter substrate-binding protein [bacterium]|nr:ABC transporter substrate-binding protein [bacterium]